MTDDDVRKFRQAWKEEREKDDAATLPAIIGWCLLCAIGGAGLWWFLKSGLYASW